MFNPAIAVGTHSTPKYEQTLINRLRERQALQYATAQPLPELSSGQRRRVDRLIERGVLRLAGSDRYYLDEDALQEWRSRQRNIAFAISVVAAGIVSIVALMQ
jgi:hypothetical protein